MTEIVFAAVLGALVAGAGAWVTWGRSMVSRQDVAEIVAATAIGERDAKGVCETHCPWIPQEKSVLNSLERIEQQLDVVTREQQLLKERVAGISEWLSRGGLDGSRRRG